MERPQRLIFLALAIAWALFRLARYLRASHARRPGAAIPSSGGMPPEQAATVAAPVPSPIEPADGGSRRARLLATAGILIAGNVVIWPLLFAIPALEEVPTMPRLVAGVLANLILLRVASGVTGRTPGAANDERNPIK